MADEEKVAAARVAIARGIAGKHARGGDLELKGYRPKPGGIARSAGGETMEEGGRDGLV